MCIKNSRSGRASRGSAGSNSDSKERAGSKRSGKSRTTPTPPPSSPSIGPKPIDTGTFEPLIHPALQEWISSAEGIRASRFHLPAPEGERQTLATFGQPCSKSFAFYDRASCSWKMSQATFLWDSDAFSETWPSAGTMRTGKCYPLPELEHRTLDDESLSWRTPIASDGSKQGRGNLSDQVSRHLWPTPRATKASTENEASWMKRNADGKVSTPPLSLAVRMWPTPRSTRGGSATETVKKMWPTPSSNNGTGGATGLAGGSGNRKKLYKMLGYEEGKKLGCQSLNPYWVEWLMGFPLGWTVLDASETPSSRRSRKKSAG